MENQTQIEQLSCSKTSKAVGPYSKATKINLGEKSLIYTAGSIGVDINGAMVSDNVGEQTKQALINLQYVLEENESSLDNVIKATVFLVSMDDFKAVNEVYATFFKNTLPARSCVAVAALPLSAKVEIELVALAENKQKNIK